MAYTTVANVENYLRTTFTTTTEPTLAEVTQLVTEIDAEVDRLTNTTYETVAADSQIYDIDNDENSFLVRRFPLNGVPVASLNIGTEFVPVWEVLTEVRTDYNIVILGSYYTGNQKIKIDYNYGYDYLPTEATKLATLIIVSLIMGSDTTSSSDFESYSIGPISAKTNIGVGRFINIDRWINRYIKQLGKFKKING